MAMYTSVCNIKRRVGGAREITQVVDRPSRHSGEECAFRDTVGVEVCETGHGHSQDRVQFFIFYLTVGPIKALLSRAVIHHLVGVLETEHLGSGGAGHAQFLDDRQVLASPKN